MQEYEHTGWEYRGTIKDFMNLIRWALVFQDIPSKDDLMDIIRDKDKTQEYAISKGMTLRAIVDEMQIVEEAMTDMLDEMERKQCAN